MIWFYLLSFLILCFLLYIAAGWLVGGLMRIAKYLGWREFVLSFFVVSFAGAVPNLLVGIFSALNGIPELSLGDIVGGNVIDFTLAIALATLIAKELPARSRTVQATSIFAIVVAILPLLLILDGVLGRGDGLLLIGCFLFYVGWLFSKEERFTRIYDEKEEEPFIKEFKFFLRDFGRVILGLIIIMLATNGIVKLASLLAQSLNLSIILIGILIVSLGNSLPETYFAMASAREGDTWMILGGLMGSVIAPSTLILGLVSLIAPIKIVNFSLFAIARFFLIVAALFFFFFVRTDRKITKREAIFLLVIYLLFVLVEVIAI